MARRRKGNGQMSGKVTRDSLALVISRKMGLSVSKSSKFVDVTIARMADGIVHDEKLMLSGFGLFRVHVKKERIGRNPKTGVDAVIAARKSVAFRQAKALSLKDTL
jgi:integration host factor subunit alpha